MGWLLVVRTLGLIVAGGVLCFFCGVLHVCTTSLASVLLSLLFTCCGWVVAVVGRGWVGGVCDKL